MSNYVKKLTVETICIKCNEQNPGEIDSTCRTRLPE